MKTYKYHYFYKITNCINNHFYYGVHNTNNLDDGYMGSGRRLRYAYKKYGIENFKKEIVCFFDSAEEAFAYESEIVTDFLVKDIMCYNMKTGGDYGWKSMKNTVSVKDKNGNTFRVHKYDDRYMNGEYVGVTYGRVVGEDENGNRFFVDKNDNRFLTGELHHLYIGMVHCKDKNGNVFVVSKNDERILRGELVHVNKGRHHSEETKQKIRESLKNVDKSHKTCWVCNEIEIIKINKTDLDSYLSNGYQRGKQFHIVKNKKLSEKLLMIKHQKGEKNSQYGTCWIHNDKQSIKIKKNQLNDYITNGWVKGRKIKF